MRDRKLIGSLLAVLGIALIVGCLDWTAQALPGQNEAMQDDRFPGEPPDDFFAGDYLIIGQKPADGPAYKGRARIEIKDNHQIRLSRTINGRTTTVEGKFAPAGELKKKSLQFSWKDGLGQAEMVCQYAVDLDNYARLSCVWASGKKSSGRLPGFESFYPLAGLEK